jgi:glycosyltransferase involved in cell wall biosynthesis
MRFSIVTPVLNGMPWLPETVESVARQRDVVDVEHLIRDGGSTDDSRDWLVAHAGLGYHVAMEKDGGQTDALAIGFEQVRLRQDRPERGHLRPARDLVEVVADRVLHPGVGGQDEVGRENRSERDGSEWLTTRLSSLAASDGSGCYRDEAGCPGVESGEASVQAGRSALPRAA